VGAFGVLRVEIDGASNVYEEGPVPIKEDKVMTTAELDGRIPLFGGTHSTVVAEYQLDVRHKLAEMAILDDESSG
jgi:hypothetical protein